jgi:hypothetical protein
VDWGKHLRRIIAHPLQGDDALFTHGTGNPALSVKGRFAAPGATLPGGIESGFTSTVPRFVAMSADVPAIAEDDTLQVLPLIDGAIGTVNYRIVAIEPDELGGYTVLQLEKA